MNIPLGNLHNLREKNDRSYIHRQQAIHSAPSGRSLKGDCPETMLNLSPPPKARGNLPLAGGHWQDCRFCLWQDCRFFPIDNSVSR